MTQDNNPKYVIVSKEPTEDMKDAGYEVHGGKFVPEKPQGVFKAMLAASPRSHGLVMVSLTDLETVLRGSPPWSDQSPPMSFADQKAKFKAALFAVDEVLHAAYRASLEGE